MWFKNLQIYRFTKPFELSAEEMSEQLAANPFKPCAGQDLSRSGWVAPLGSDAGDLVHAANGCLMVCARRQERVLPAAVVNEALEEQVEALKAAENRAVGRKERQTLKEELLFTLLPRAFTRSSRQYAYIDPRAGLLVVDAASAKRAEELLSSLRESLGTLPVIPLLANNMAQHVMTDWLRNSSAAAGFELGDECELRSLGEEVALVRCKNIDLRCDEVVQHIQSGMYASKLSLHWQGGIDCLVDEQLAVKRLRFGDLIQEKAALDAPDALEQFDADFAIMSAELSSFIAALIEAFALEDSAETAAS